ncbi:hypothetical protein FISHEDRAFT_58316 [Fistulina hepatica ATCC 64428]|nr:hypothetical protein FISHEDRAFT_58316 [Fistulina hepatica ATCC 64428]
MSRSAYTSQASTTSGGPGSPSRERQPWFHTHGNIRHLTSPVNSVVPLPPHAENLRMPREEPSFEPEESFLEPASADDIQRSASTRESKRFVGGFKHELVSSLKKALTREPYHYQTPSTSISSLYPETPKPEVVQEPHEVQLPMSHTVHTTQGEEVAGTTVVEHPHPGPASVRSPSVSELDYGASEMQYAPDYAKMPSPPHTAPSLPAYIARLGRFLKEIRDLPWIAQGRVTIDYVPSQERRRLAALESLRQPRSSMIDLTRGMSVRRSPSAYPQQTVVIPPPMAGPVQPLQTAYAPTQRPVTYVPPPQAIIPTAADVTTPVIPAGFSPHARLASTGHRTEAAFPLTSARASEAQLVSPQTQRVVQNDVPPQQTQSQAQSMQRLGFNQAPQQPHIPHIVISHPRRVSHNRRQLQLRPYPDVIPTPP